MKAPALVFGLLAATAAWADETDYTPDFGALDGATLNHSVEREFDSYRLPVGRFTRDAQPVERLEGLIREFVYVVDGEMSTLEAVRNYQRRLSDLGFATLFECAGEECGGFDFRFGVYLVEPPAMRFDLADFRYLAAADRDLGRHVSVLASRQGGKLFVQVVTVDGEPAPEVMTPEEPPRPPAAKPSKAQLYALARRLTENGFAALEGIDFEVGSARLTKESVPALDQAASLLRARPDLTFLVVGHTDNDGALELNLELSRKRAEAVAERIASAEGVERSQLVARGVGFLAPRASNATPEGRAMNRRVELVIQ